MATRTHTTTDISHAVKLTTWSGLLNGDDGSTLDAFAYTDKCMTVQGTFGAGGTVVVEGSNDGTNFFTMNDPQGNALSVTVGKIEQILENPRYIRPRVTAGDGTTNLSVIILSKGTT